MTLVKFVVILFVFSVLGWNSTVSAHELLPQEVITFIQANPNATPEEMRAFAATQDPKVAAAFTTTSTQELLALVQNQDNSFLHNAYDFIKLGVEHILAGADHILFVLTLLLVFASVREILKLITAFTIAHSLTLILAGSGTLVLSSLVVEPIIALSIAVMAIATVFYRESSAMKNQVWKIGLVFFFGLFHGLGFAGLLQEISIPDNKFLSSLVAFNIGIECGQLVIIGLALPIIFYFRNRIWYPRVIQIAAIVISVIALVWFVERIVRVIY